MSAAPTSPSCEFIRRFRHDKKLWSGRFSADGARIFVQDQSFTEIGDDDCNRGYIWDVKTGDMLYRGSIDPRGCSANCDYYAPEVVDDDPVHRIYKVGSNEPVLEFEGCVWFGDSPHIAVLDRIWRKLSDDSITYEHSQLYDFVRGHAICDLAFIPDGFRILKINEDGTRLLTTAKNTNEISAWDISAQKRIAHLAPSAERSIKGHLDTIKTALFLPGQNDRVMTITAPRVYSEGLDPMAAIIWDVESAEPLAQILCGGDRTANPNPHDNACDIYHHFTFTDDGTWFAALRADGYTGPNESMMRVFDTRSGEEVVQFEVGGIPQRIAGAPNAPYMAATTFQSPLVCIFDIVSKEEVAHCAAPAFMSDTPAIDIAFAPASPDGQFVLTTHEGGDAILWRMPDWV